MTSEKLTTKGDGFLKGTTACLPVGLAPFARRWNCVHLATKEGNKNMYSHKSVFKAAVVCPLNMDSCNCQNKL